jgi:hypothetical protein
LICRENSAFSKRAFRCYVTMLNCMTLWLSCFKALFHQKPKVMF